MSKFERLYLITCLLSIILQLAHLSLSIQKLNLTDNVEEKIAIIKLKTINR